MTEGWVICGHFGRPHGVRGQIRLWCHNPHTDLLYPKQTIWTRADHSAAFTIEEVRFEKKGALVKLSEIDSRDHAKELVTQPWWMPRTQLPPLPQDEFYFIDLLGASGQTTEGRSVGILKDVIEAGAGEILVFWDSDHSIEHMVPYMPPFIHSVDPEKREIIVYPVEGLLSPLP